LVEDIDGHVGTNNICGGGICGGGTFIKLGAKCNNKQGSSQSFLLNLLGEIFLNGYFESFYGFVLDISWFNLMVYVF